VCWVTKEDEAGAQTAMVMQVGEASTAAGPAGVTRCLDMNAEYVGGTVVGKDVLTCTEPRPCV